MEVEFEAGELVTVPLEKIQEFQAWARKIKPLLQLLDKAPTSELELEICSDENQIGKNSKFLLDNDKLGEKCEALYNELLAKVEESSKENKMLLDDMFMRLKKLDDKEEIPLAYSSADSRFGKLVSAVIAHCAQMDKERSQRVQVYIGELRKEIAEIWTKCMITEDEKNEFKEFHSDQYTEEMLEIHKEELKKWQIYHAKNQEILTKISKREEMWIKLRELEAKADDPNRFVNRGGALLKDQNLHNSITKNLPKLEAELINLAEVFHKEHGRTMKINGKEIPLMVEEDWKLFKLEKAAKKAPRPIVTPVGPISVPLRTTQQSIKPPNQFSQPGSTSSVAAEKRPGSRLTPGVSTPAMKRKFFSSDSVQQ